MARIVITQSEREESGTCGGRMIRMRSLVPSVPEIRTLLAQIIFPPPLIRALVFSWSLWRRTDQAPAAEAHYRNSASQYVQL